MEDYMKVLEELDSTPGSDNFSQILPNLQKVFNIYDKDYSVYTYENKDDRLGLITGHVTVAYKDKFLYTTDINIEINRFIFNIEQTLYHRLFYTAVVINRLKNTVPKLILDADNHTVPRISTESLIKATADLDEQQINEMCRFIERNSVSLFNIAKNTEFKTVPKQVLLVFKNKVKLSNKIYYVINNSSILEDTAGLVTDENLYKKIQAKYRLAISS